MPVDQTNVAGSPSKRTRRGDVIDGAGTFGSLQSGVGENDSDDIEGMMLRGEYKNGGYVHYGSSSDEDDSGPLSYKNRMNGASSSSRRLPHP